MKKTVAITSLLTMAGVAAQSQATITLNHGNALFVDSAPALSTTTHFGGGGSNTTDVLRPEGGTSTNHLFESGWGYRINGLHTREFAFSLSGAVEAGSGTNTGTRTYANIDGMFSAVCTYTLTDGGAPGQALVVQSLTVTNISNSSLSMALFNYIDYDINGSTTNSTSWDNQANNVMRIANSANPSIYGLYQGVGADAWQVASFATLRTSLTDTGLTNLTSSGIPHSGDFTGAFQWNRTIAAGQSVTVSAVLAINQAVPAPGALALLGLAGLCGARRRRA